MDLLSLKILVADSPTRNNDWDQILNHYHQTITRILEKFKLPSPTIEQLKMELKDNSIHEVREVICGLKFHCMHDIFVPYEVREKDRFARSRLVFEKEVFRKEIKLELERLMKECAI